MPHVPSNIRVYELARELGMTNAETLDLAESLGIGVKSHSSSIVDAQPRMQALMPIALGSTPDHDAGLFSGIENLADPPRRRLVHVGQAAHAQAGRLQHAGMVMLPSGPTHVHISKPANFPGYFGSTLTPRNYSAVTAAAMLTLSEAFDSVSGFDTAFARDFNDVDYCLRLQEAGYRVAWTPYAHLTHHEGASIVRKAANPSELAEFRRRWADVYQVDPYYSPALNPVLERIYEAL